MKKAKGNNRAGIVTHFLGVYRYLLIVFLFLLFAYIGSAITTSMAAPAGQAEFGTFNAQVCTIVQTAGTVVGALAVIMVMAAGIMYALSGGDAKGDLSIGTAKNMIVSAITGVLLYLMGSVLLGNCGDYSGGLLRQWIKPPATTSYQVIVDRVA